ncbi:hypothetical protein LSCM1_00193 [Leishmania martiniquensis]|uniref:Uncharacterized protein n=1 Tax=Leishmania martiniquensis TaxID=1580590 RepID=A0A836K5P8_9TRYP|nr:hypothetical protein LSCM1_00193 [Leishmania martiniquensis]
MRPRDVSVRRCRSPAASTGESSAKVSPASPPAISTVCVDVRELLRCSFASSDDAPVSVQASASDRQQVTAVDLSAVPRQPPRQAQAALPRFQKGLAFWSPSYPPLGGFAAHSAPPPLSPTDATILHSILDQPSMRTTVFSGSAQLPDLTGSPLAQKPRGRRPSLESDAAAPPPTPPSMWQCSVSTCPPPHDGSSARGTTEYAEGSAQESRVDMATPFSLLPEVDTSPPTPLRDAGETFLNEAQPNAAGAAASTDLSPAAQRTMKSILGHLGSCSREVTAADSGAGVEMAKDSYRGGRIAPLLPFREAAMRASETRSSADSPPLSNGAFARAAKESSVGAAARPTMAQLWRLCPALAASTFSRLDTHQQRSLCAAQAVLAPQQGFTHNRPHASAGSCAVPLLKSSRSPHRTVPPAFRRQLQFAEAAPTTRRPKRK